jgi:hypothetical protein
MSKNVFKSSQGIINDITSPASSGLKMFIPQKRLLPPHANENRSNQQIEMVHKSKFSMQKGTPLMGNREQMPTVCSRLE